MVTNQEIARILYQIAEFLEMKNVPFKPRAYEKSARVVESLEEPVEEIYKKSGLKGLEEIPGVGISIASKVVELVKTGHLKYYQELKKEIPVDVEALSAIEGVGPKMIITLYKKLGIRNVADLEKAAKTGKIRKLEHFGEKTEQKIVKGIEFHKKHGGRFLLGEVLPLALSIRDRLRKLSQVELIEIVGSIRRRKETVGDGDFLVVSSSPDKVMDYFVSMPEVIHVYAKGGTKTMVRLKNGLDLDLRVVPRESFGAALNYFTGNKDHNVTLRQLAIKRGLKLSEYGVFGGKKGDKYICGRTEEEIYKILDLEYIEPELRESTGEIEAARQAKLPKLVGYDDLMGDLQVQSNWTDGEDSIEDLARAALKLGHKYIAITDHTKRLAMTHGLDERRLLKQMAEIDRINTKFKDISILKGTECDILKDGSLDLPNKILAKLDVVGVSVHSYFNMSRHDMTKRIIKAISNPHVDIFFHPTGRIINKRAPYEVDMDEVIAAAKRTGTVLEANAYWQRLDLKDEYIRKAVSAGVKIAIDSDAHSIAGLNVLHYGIAQARRGWTEKRSVINTYPLKQMLKALKDK
ncbi:MAG: DNA polymerase III [Candidatus Terrybacteria bacterium RIFCSPLOWO2_01_FULL_44_24]|uniref:DNA polymerase beta n=1 Tax=Candidatus Terrybacteria bacterium RIFCSPHIGHO2_01_FULL_43_35 TaxID=1802361 RepID=A0A1G2PEK5_9BACT|nr:MAG: DNA polymerase III [Candidatus Terrybacteria bacterium RIFCSPHIGHO2_01_FULL_43_35]OHA50859.1 MAG: DNA polymerase III [Candidatus Terrybacteria bacterium RIFCSPLOWO2_01_FULL_44_24]